MGEILVVVRAVLWLWLYLVCFAELCGLGTRSCAELGSPTRVARERPRIHEFYDNKSRVNGVQGNQCNR